MMGASVCGTATICGISTALGTCIVGSAGEPGTGVGGGFLATRQGLPCGRLAPASGARILPSTCLQAVSRTRNVMTLETPSLLATEARNCPTPGQSTDAQKVSPVAHGSPAQSSGTTPATST